METSSERPQRSLKTLILKQADPAFEIDTEHLGRLNFEGDLRVTDIIELSKLDGNDELTAEGLANNLIRLLGSRRGQSGEPGGEPGLFEDDVQKLTQTERQEILARLSEALKLHSQNKTTLEDNGEGVVAPHDAYELVLPRNEGELEESYLLRSWRDYKRRFTEGNSRLTDLLKGVSAAMRSAVLPSFAANKVAASGLSDQIARMRSTQGIAGGVDLQKRLNVPDLTIADGARATGKINDLIVDSPSQVPLVTFPPNPIHETNDLLEEMGRHIADMTELARRTAEMQGSLNDAAVEILTLFGKGAEDSRRASRLGLIISLISIAIAVAAILANVAMVFHEDGHSAQVEARNAKNHAAEVKSASDAINRLTEVIEPPSGPSQFGAPKCPTGK